jgi:hypothetical protein
MYSVGWCNHHNHRHYFILEKLQWIYHNHNSIFELWSVGKKNFFLVRLVLGKHYHWCWWVGLMQLAHGIIMYLEFAKSNWGFTFLGGSWGYLSARIILLGLITNFDVGGIMLRIAVLDEYLNSSSLCFMSGFSKYFIK